MPPHPSPCVGSMACAFQMRQLPSGDAPTEKPDWSSGAVQVDVNLYIRHRKSFFALDERALEALMRPEPDQRYLASGLQDLRGRLLRAFRALRPDVDRASTSAKQKAAQRRPFRNPPNKSGF